MVMTKKYDWEQKLPDLSRSNVGDVFIIPEQTLIIEEDVKFSVYLSWRKHDDRVEYVVAGRVRCTEYVVRFQIKPIEGVNISSAVLEYSMNSPNGKIRGTISNLQYDKEKNIHYYDQNLRVGDKTFFSIFNEKNSKDGTTVTYSLTVELALPKLPALLFADKGGLNVF